MHFAHYVGLQNMGGAKALKRAPHLDYLQFVALLQLHWYSCPLLISTRTLSVNTSDEMSAGISNRLPEIVSTLKILKNVVALAPLGEQVGAGIELAISICEMAEVRIFITL
jgi:hypothetical protein